MSEDQISNDHKKLFNAFMKVLKDGEKTKFLKEFLEALQNHSLQESIEHIYKFHLTISETNKKINDLHSEAQTNLKSINEVYDEIYNINNDDGNKTSQIFEDIKKIRDIQKNVIELQQIYDEYYNFYNGDGGVVPALDELCKQIKENKDIIGELKENKDIIGELKDFYQEVFEGSKNENGEEIKSIKATLQEKINQLNNLRSTKDKELTAMINDNNKKLTELYNTKKDEIEGLLPGATTSGLAKAYANEREASKEGVAWWNKLFKYSVGTFILVFSIYFYTSFQEGFTYISVLRSLPIWVFSGFFVFYSTKQIAEYKRMESEYAYKQRLSETYVGYEKQIAKLENKELKEELLEIMVNSAKFNPSELLDNKGEVPSFTILEKSIDLLSVKSLKKVRESIDKKIDGENR